MKNLKIIIGFIIILIISCGISVYATSTYLASDISYNSTNVASALNDLYSVAQIGVGNHYSTNEQVVGTWIDGKPLYQKTYNTTFPNADTGTLLSVPNANFDVIVEIKGTFLNSNGHTTTFSPTYGGMNVYPEVSTGNIYCEGVQTWLRSRSGQLTIQYTKTTDTATTN